MLNRIQKLEKAVANLYEAKNPGRADWADWLAANHVFLVADNAVKLARQMNANEELSRAAALLHDIADAVMSRFDPNHEVTGLEIARELMRSAGFTENEIQIVVDDAIRLHSCYHGLVPKSLVGKVLSSADSQAHLLSDFYLFAAWSFGKEGKNFKQVKDYVKHKTRRDFHDKIQFEMVRQECRTAYDHLQSISNI